MNPSAAVNQSRTTRPSAVDVRRTGASVQQAARPINDLTDNVLLRICRVGADDPKLRRRLIWRLRQVVQILVEPGRRQDARLESAMTLLASALGLLPKYNPTHLPFGYNGPSVRSRDWIEREAFERVGKQIVGFAWQDREPEAVSFAVRAAVSRAIALGFVEQRRYDAWRPGMPSGSGWRFAVAATQYGLTRARGQAPAQDGERAQMHATESDQSQGSYLYVTSSEQAELTPATAFHLAPDEEIAESLCRLFAREYGDDTAARFHHKRAASVSREDQILLDEALDWLEIYDDPDPGVYDPPPTPETQIRAQYATRARRWEEMLKDRAMRTRRTSGNADAVATMGTDGSRDDLTSRQTGTLKTQPAQAPSSTTAPDDKYEWARQADLVQAVNQVLGQRMLNKGVLSRACAEGQVETNRKKGHAARVRVRSFLAWLSRRFQIGRDEENQVRNAVIGEINSRNS